MKTIHKYPVPMEDEFVVMMPEWAEVLTTEAQYGEPFVWALVETDNAKVERRFRLCGTGHPAPNGEMDYVGSFQLTGGAFVGHIFVDREGTA